MRKLSMLVPVRFTTVYRRGGSDGQPVFARWWQWRGHVFAHKAIAF